MNDTQSKTDNLLHSARQHRDYVAESIRTLVAELEAKESELVRTDRRIRELEAQKRREHYDQMN